MDAGDEIKDSKSEGALSGTDAPITFSAPPRSAPSGPVARGSRRPALGRVAVSCRVRPLLECELEQGVSRAGWALTDTTICLADKKVPRMESDGRFSFLDGDSSGKTRSEVRTLEHLRRDDNETVMDHVFGEECSTRDVYHRAFRGIVEGAAEGLNGAILAYGQTASGKTYSISGSSASTSSTSPATVEGASAVKTKGIIDFALEDLFQKLRENSKPSSANEAAKEFLVRMSYCEVYMEKVNDLLRKISPQSQNLPVKEDSDGKGFYVEGLKEKIVGSAEEVVSLLQQSEKRRRVAYTRYNEVSSRSHTIVTLCVESSSQLVACDSDETPADSHNQEAGEDKDAFPRVTRVGRLVIVDLAGNERLHMGSEYMAESNSINQSLFFLGKVIEKLAQRDRRRSRNSGNLSTEESTAGSCDTEGGFGARTSGSDHVPIRESKLTRLLSVHLGGNSNTGLLVTMTPARDAVEQTLATLRFARKAGQVRCVPRPVLINKEQSLILKQREIIAQLQTQVRELRCERTPTEKEPDQEDGDLAKERQEAVEQLQALTLQPSSPGRHSFVSRSREVDAVVTALHRNNDALKKQRATLIGQFQQLHRAVAVVAGQVAQATEALSRPQSGGQIFHPPTSSAAAWAPAIDDLYIQLQRFLVIDEKNANKKETVNVAVEACDIPSPSEQALLEENQALQAKLESIVAEREVLGLASQAADARFASVIADAMASFKGVSVANAMETFHSRPENQCKYLIGHDQDRVSQLPPGHLHSDRFLDTSPTGLLWSDTNGGTGATESPMNSTARQVPIRTGQSKADVPPDASADVVAVAEHKSWVTEAEGVKIGSIADGCSSPSLAGSRKLSEGNESPAECFDPEEFEPIVERIRFPEPPKVGPALKGLAIHRGDLASPQAERATAPRPASRERPPLGNRKPQPPEVSGPGSSSHSYLRQFGGCTRWRTGDTAYWRGQPCEVLRCLPEEHAVCAILRTPSGSEVTTDLFLLSEAPAGIRSTHVSKPSGSDCGVPFRLAPLADFCIDRHPAQVPWGSHCHAEEILHV